MWDSVPEAVRHRVDELISRDLRIQAVAALREALPAPKPGLYDCLDAVMARYQELGRRFEPWPTPPVDAALLARKVQALPCAPAAIEAVWDGDTFGWCVRLIARTEEPGAEHTLALIRHGGDMRLFNGEVPPWPEAQEANRAGQELADRLAIPFHPADPDTPSLPDL